MPHPLIEELRRCLEDDHERRKGKLRNRESTIPHKVISFVAKMTGADEGSPKELDSSGLEALTAAGVALLASVFCWISIDSIPVSAALEASFLTLISLVLIALSYTLRTFAEHERRRTIEEMIDYLESSLGENSSAETGDSRRLPTDRETLLRQLRERDRCARTMTPARRANGWEWTPNNLLVKGDLIALTHGRFSPCEAERVADGYAVARDHRVPRLLSPSAKRNIDSNVLEEETQAKMLIDSVDMEIYRVKSTPLAADVQQFLREARTAQRSYLGYQFNIAFKIELAASVVFAIFFGLVLGAVRYAVSAGGLHWSVLILQHSASFLILLPPQSLTVYRSLLEVHYTVVLHNSLVSTSAEDGGRGRVRFSDVARRWLLHGAVPNSAKATRLPLAPSTIVRVIGSVTAACALDEESVLEGEPKVEEVFLLKGGEGRFRLLDCCPDPSALSGMRFEDPQWSAHISSLKPLGLACAVLSECDAKGRLEGGKRATGGGDVRGLARLLERERWSPTCFWELSSAVGFRRVDVEGFTPTSRTLVVVGGESSKNSSPFMRECNSMATFHGKPALECVVVERLAKPVSSSTTLPPPPPLSNTIPSLSPPPPLPPPPPPPSLATPSGDHPPQDHHRRLLLPHDYSSKQSKSTRTPRLAPLFLPASPTTPSTTPTPLRGNASLDMGPSPPPSWNIRMSIGTGSRFGRWARTPRGQSPI